MSVKNDDEPGWFERAMAAENIWQYDIDKRQDKKIRALSRMALPQLLDMDEVLPEEPGWMDDAAKDRVYASNEMRDLALMVMARKLQQYTQLEPTVLDHNIKQQRNRLTGVVRLHAGAPSTWYKLPKWYKTALGIIALVVLFALYGWLLTLGESSPRHNKWY